MASSYPVGGGVVGGVPGQDSESSQISQPNQQAAPSQSHGQTYHDQQSLVSSPQQQRQLPAYQSHHAYQTHQPSTEQTEASAAAAAAAAAVAVASDGLAALQQATALSGSNVVPETPTYSPLVSAQAQYSMSPGGQTSQSTPSQSKNQITNSAKASRLRRACDLCSQRKVKVSFGSALPLNA
jgi:hypothetical protein